MIVKRMTRLKLGCIDEFNAFLFSLDKIARRMRKDIRYQWWRQRGAGGGATAPLSGSASPPVGENLYICWEKLTKI